MPLERIEVCDFKSYRGHQTIGPFKSFSSVIGPNGAGKSNLMDAISFVLGVKSAQLRSSQLKDLVYRGRKLVEDDSQLTIDGEDEQEADGEGTAKKAWVLAVYSDEKGKEWRFQRTISTTGASEYRLNNKVVTYASYNETLASHNILVKAKNFLVFQGDVEAVASQSPRELSKLIDQISGSLELAPEYDKCKQAQDKATENATANFAKKRGVNGEIKQYKEQKGEAERFEQLVAEKEDAVLRRILYKLYHLEESIEVNGREIESANKKLASLRSEQKVHDDALKDARVEQAKARTNVVKKEKRVKTAEKALENKKPDLAALDAQIAHSTRKKNTSAKTSEEVARNAATQQAKLDNLKKDLTNTKALADEVQEKQREASQQNMALSEESLVEYRRLKAAASVLAVEERQSLETLARDEKTTQRSLTQLQERQDAFQEKRAKLEADVETHSTRKAELDAKLAGLKAELDEARQKLNNQQSERTKITRLEAEANEKLEDCYNKIYQAGVDKHELEKDTKLRDMLANLQHLFKGVHGRVVDLCKPTARKYETAVSVILGRNIDSIVVDEEATAIQCIHYLRDQRAGHATFIPLDTIQVKPINDKFRSFAKGARLAVDVIQFEPAVERAIHHACGNALVCDTLAIATHVCFDKSQEVKAVTLDGSIIHKSGLMTGGRSSHNSGKKWDAKELEGLQRVRAELSNQLRELQKAKPRANVDENLVAEITRIEGTMTVVRDDLEACKSRLKGSKDELKHVEAELKKNAPLLREASRKHAGFAEQIEALSMTINEAEDEVFADFCSDIGVANIREYESRQLKVAQEESEARLRYDTQIARLTHQSEFEAEQLQGIKDRLKTLQTTVTTEEANLTKLAEQKEALEEELTALEMAIVDAQEELESAKKTLGEATEQVDAVKKTTGKAGKVLDQALKDIALKNDEIEKCAMERKAIYRQCKMGDIDLPLLEGDLKDVPMEDEPVDDQMQVDDEDGTQHVRPIESYKIEVDFAELEDDERDDPSPEKAAEYDALIKKLNAEIEGMAPNMKANEKLEDVEQKLMETEKEAKKALKESKAAKENFSDVKRRRCELFNKAYSHISDRIDQVYKDLTKGKAAPMGGVAYLSLEDSEEPYTAGINYHAMPPMKRFRDMEQLSGGEKTVAALALLFAIHSFQPAPFFVLDEVDAALDNQNVAKIANYIRSQASDEFQFIVISLKGSLYERGNSLVGIYRDQEINSSRTLTLDLTQYDE